MEQKRYENKSICAECSSVCCKKCGCDYLVSDFTELKIKTIEEALDTKRVSIVAALEISITKNCKVIINPILYLRARNINRGEIDLISLKTACYSLEEDGCHFDLNNRPSAGATLIPNWPSTCIKTIDPVKELSNWLPYQSILQRVVKRRTGMSVHAKLEEDITNLYIDMLSQNFDGVSNEAIEEYKEILPILLSAYYPDLQDKIMHKFNGPVNVRKRK